MAGGKRSQPQTSWCPGSCRSQPGGLMLLGRIFRVALGSAQGAGALRRDTFLEPPESLPKGMLQQAFPMLGCQPLASFQWAGSRTCSIVGTAQKKHHLRVRLCLHSHHEGLGGSAESGTISARSPRPNGDTRLHHWLPEPP